MESCAKENLRASLDLPTDTGFIGSVVDFKDGSVWMIKEPLIARKYQQSNPPFEARQVFTCVCIEDPLGLYDGVEEAIMKVKFQIRGTHEIIEYYTSFIGTCREDLNEYPDSESCAASLEWAESLLYKALHPQRDPNEATIKEVEALQYFRDMGCAYTPHLLSQRRGTVLAGTDEEEIVGGFMIFILMTKLPGEKLTYDKYWNLSMEERDEIRKAFKEALEDVVRLRIWHQDRAMRNLIWDRQNRKCYIVDFEDYALLDKPDIIPLGEWVYEGWELAEECSNGWCKGSDVKC